MRDMRDNYFKDLSNLRQQLERKKVMEEQGRGDEFVPNHIMNFDPTKYQVEDAVKQEDLEAMKREHEAALQKVKDDSARMSAYLTEQVRYHKSEADWMKELFERS